MITIFCSEEKSKLQIREILNKLKLKNFLVSNTFLIPNAFLNVGICDSCDDTSLIYFKDKNIPVITCGMGTKNTLTLSSFDDTSAIITIQRKLPFENDKHEKPEEISLRFKNGLTAFTVMAIFAVIKLSDNNFKAQNENGFINCLN